ncbi:undecaprenyl-diphosphatase UppP [Firmicutes bacterium M10-2]|nr:undecaprenyl-diphosphatase UppP [Firmicutes bacterium M10-2]
MHLIFDWIHSILLGILTGITECLPISSKAHLLIVQGLWQLSPNRFYQFFKVAIEIGTICAIFYVFRKVLFSSHGAEKKKMFHLWKNIFFGSLPIGVGIFLIGSWIQKYLDATFVIVVSLISIGIIFLLIPDRSSKEKITSLEKLDPLHAFVIGLVQCVALIPGASYYAFSILGGLYVGCSKETASRFGYLLMGPALLFSGLFEVYVYFWMGNTISLSQVIMIILGSCFSFVCAVATIRIFLNFIKNHSWKGIGWYRIALGVLIFMTFCV